MVYLLAYVHFCLLASLGFAKGLTVPCSVKHKALSVINVMLTIRFSVGYHLFIANTFITANESKS